MIRPVHKFQMNIEMLKDKVARKQARISENDELLTEFRYRVEQVKSRIAKYQEFLCETVRPSEETGNNEVELLRRRKLKQVSWILENNRYFPAFSISELFQLEKCIRYSQIVQDEESTKSIDKPSYIVSLKTEISRFMTDEHRQAMGHSIGVLCLFIQLASKILNISLPCTLTFREDSYMISDLKDNEHRLSVDDMSSLENGLIFLYQDYSYFQQQAGVDLTQLAGLFDVNALVSSPFLGKRVTIPSLPLPTQKPTHHSEDDEDWEFLVM